jgi:hypothetical protein
MSRVCIDRRCPRHRAADAGSCPECQLRDARAEIERLTRSRDGWEADAATFAKDAHYWRNRAEAAEAESGRVRAEVAELKFAEKQLQGLWACDREERDKAEAESGRLRSLVRCLLDNEPDDVVADGGITVLMVWRQDARRALGLPEERQPEPEFDL